MYNMADNMNKSAPLTLNTTDSDNSFSEIVNISIDNLASKKYVCNHCDFKSSDIGGMKRHIGAKHRSKKHARDDSSVSENSEVKKLKADSKEGVE